MRFFMLDWISISCFSSLLILVSNIRSQSGLGYRVDDIGCFSDCYKEGHNYVGIRSVLRDGRVCRDWKDTRYAARNDLKANLCASLDEKRPRCVSPSNNDDYCEVPECSTSTGCVTILNKEQYVTSVTLKWSSSPILVPIYGYLVLLHNNNRVCEHAIIQLCDSCGSMSRYGSQIKSLYISCKTINEESPIKNETKFVDLQMNTKYNVYITPIIDSSSVGNIREIMVRTVSVAKPHIPTGVNYQLDTIRNIKFSWQKNVETQTNGPAESYVACITNNNKRRTVSKRINTESVSFSGLEMCTEYCFVLSSYNRAGESGYTKEICTFTLAPKPEKSMLADPPSGYMRSQSLSWTYLGSDNCSRTYRVEYLVRFLEESALNSDANDTNVQLTNLKPNVIYSVRVRAQGQMRTVNHETIGEFSAYKEFYTGKLQPNLSYYEQNLDHTNKVLNISWRIEEEMKGSIFKYIIQVKNVSNLCWYSAVLEPKTCREPWCLRNVKQQDKESLKKMINCDRSLNENIEVDQTSFNYIFNSEKEFTNFSVVLYGVNLMGIHVLNDKSTITPTSGTSFPVLIPWIIVIIVVLVLLVSISIVIGLRFKKKTVKVEESYLMNRIQKLETLKKKIIISVFPSYYQRVSKFGGAKLIKQYKKLYTASKTQETTLHLTVFEGKELKNLRKNRFANIFPYDQHRVKVGQMGPPLDYINASYIPYENDEAQIEYIAAQGPIEDTLSEFWQMIWEQNIHCIVMLTRRREKHRFKCLQYWPNDAEESVSYGNHNQFEVTLVREEVNEAYIERELKVVNTISRECRNLIQLHMSKWLDHSVPKLDCFRKFFFRFHEITNDDVPNPYLVHCIDGVGATGTFICIDRIVKQLVSGIQMISIFSTVLKLREYRNFMVQGEAQYIFIHKYIDHFLEKYMRMEEVNAQGYDY